MERDKNNDSDNKNQRIEIAVTNKNKIKGKEGSTDLNGKKVSDSSILEGLDKAVRQTQFRNVKFVLTSIATWLSFRRSVIDISTAGIDISFEIRKPI
jgi:hypothetical protein